MLNEMITSENDKLFKEISVIDKIIHQVHE